ncbi:MAG: hypothetical protein K8R18_03095 [Parvibaculum sp.]|uniref:hypothetical protein n=1 Tax=Parvibaculum sp. TaxID=2024848 RepID=UPI0025E85E00|nr:hypothetical protein [Parvibaculum sp.]MCE9648590.1 hypothetical protein [Parvibaculum sp.]
MESIRRIGSIQQSPARRRDERIDAAAGTPEAERRPAAARTEASARTIVNARPQAGFLTQYVDQHFPWPRAPLRKERQRQRATRAYIVADMLPDLLAETLRLRSVDRKF